MNPYLSYSENDLPSLAATLSSVLSTLCNDPVTPDQLLDIDFAYVTDIKELQELVTLFYTFSEGAKQETLTTETLDALFTAITASLDEQLDFIDDVGKHYDDMKKLDNDPE